ncbi:hypothetical protein EOM39_06180 [Candidatus Gracilibacteria bacterium]|nr:hypothetical protein [Candidatus Gracilibacteria bacterium]
MTINYGNNTTLIEQLHSGYTLPNESISNEISIKLDNVPNNYDYSNLIKVDNPKDYFGTKNSGENSFELMISRNKSIAPAYISQNFLVKKVEGKDIYILSQKDNINLKYVDLFYVNSEIDLNRIKSYIEALLSTKILLGGLAKKYISDNPLDDGYYEEVNDTPTIDSSRKEPKKQNPTRNRPNQTASYRIGK